MMDSSRCLCVHLLHLTAPDFTDVDHWWSEIVASQLFGSIVVNFNANTSILNFPTNLRA